MTGDGSSSLARAASLAEHAAAAMARRGGKNAALGAALALAVALVAAVLFFSDALRAASLRAIDAMPDVTVEHLVAGRASTVEVAAADSLRAIPSVRAVEARAWGYLFLPAIGGNVTVVGVPRGEQALSVAGGALAKGRDVTQGAHEMLAGSGLAAVLGLDVGDRLGLPSPDPGGSPLLLVGTFASSVDLYTSDVIACDEADARSLLGLPAGQATDIAVWLTNPNEAHVVATKIAALLPGSRVLERDRLPRVYALTYGRRAGLVLAAAIPALLALLVLASDRASGLGADERREIAVLKAVGWSHADVLAVKLIEALIVSFLAASVGLTLAYVWVFPLGAPGLRQALAGWSVLYPSARLTPEVDLTELVALALSVVAPFVALSIVPAWRAASLDPTESMRG